MKCMQDGTWNGTAPLCLRKLLFRCFFFIDSALHNGDTHLVITAVLVSEAVEQSFSLDAYDALMPTLVIHMLLHFRK